MGLFDVWPRNEGIAGSQPTYEEMIEAKNKGIDIYDTGDPAQPSTYGSFLYGYDIPTLGWERDKTLTSPEARGVYLGGLGGGINREQSGRVYNELMRDATGQGPSLADLQMRAAYDAQGKQLSSLLAGQRGVSSGLASKLMARQAAESGQALARDAAMARLAERQGALERAGNIATTGEQTGVTAAQIAGQNIGGESAIGADITGKQADVIQRAQESDIKRMELMAKDDETARRARESGGAALAQAAGTALASGLCKGGTVKKYADGGAFLPGQLGDTIENVGVSAASLIPYIGPLLSMGIGAGKGEVKRMEMEQDQKAAQEKAQDDFENQMRRFYGSFDAAAPKPMFSSRQALQKARSRGQQSFPGGGTVMPEFEPDMAFTPSPEYALTPPPVATDLGFLATPEPAAPKAKTEKTDYSWLKPLVGLGATLAAHFLFNRSRGKPNFNLQEQAGRPLRASKPIRFADGGTVDGKVKGVDDPNHDTVMAMVSPGEIALPLSITLSDDAPELAMEFVAKEKNKKKDLFENFKEQYGVKGYADGETFMPNTPLPISSHANAPEVQAAMEQERAAQDAVNRKALMSGLMRLKGPESVQTLGGLGPAPSPDIPGYMVKPGSPEERSGFPAAPSPEQQLAKIQNKPDFASQAAAEASDQDIAPPPEAPAKTLALQDELRRLEEEDNAGAPMELPSISAPKITPDTGYLETAKQAGEAVSAVASNMANSAAKLIDQHNKDRESILRGIDQQIAENAQQRAVLEKDILETNVDPSKFWSDKSAWQQAMGGIAAALGAYSATLSGGPNYAQQIIDKAIDREVDAQVKNLNNKRSMLNYYLNKGQSLDAARANTVATYATLIKGKLQRDALRFAGDKAKANALELQANLEQKASESALKAAQFNGQVQLEASKANLAGQLQQLKQKEARKLAIVKQLDDRRKLEFLNPITNKIRVAKDVGARDKAIAKADAIQPVAQYVEAIKKVFKEDKHGIWIPINDEAVGYIRAKAEMILPALVVASGDTRVSDQNIEAMRRAVESMIGLKTKTASGKIKALMESVDNTSLSLDRQFAVRE